MQDLQGAPQRQRLPVQFAFPRSAAQPLRDPQFVLREVAHRGRRRAGPREGVEQDPQAVPHLGVRVEHHPVERVVDEPDRQGRLQLTAPGLVQQAAQQAGLEDVQLCLRHGPLEPEQEPVVELGRIVDAILVEDQRVGQGADLEQPVPVRRVARQPRHFQPEHDPAPPQADLGDQTPEPLAVGGGARQAEIAVDHHDAFGPPAQGDRSLAQGVLPGRAFGILEHLAHGRLAHIQISVPAQVVGTDLLVGFAHAASSRRRWLAIASRMSIKAASSATGAGAGRGAVEGAGSSGEAVQPGRNALPHQDREPAAVLASAGPQRLTAQPLVAVGAVGLPDRSRIGPQAGRYFFLRARARSMLRRCTDTPKRLRTSATRSAQRRSGCSALAALNASTTSSPSLRARLGPGLAGTSAGSPPAS